jgi:uncharacterized protein
MDITPLVPKEKNLITAYGEDYIIVQENKYTIPLIITPDKLILEQVSFNQLEKILPMAEVVIIGHKQKQMRLINIKAEVMSFGAACRTYNVLLTEGRDVVCLLCDTMSHP